MVEEDSLEELGLLKQALEQSMDGVIGISLRGIEIASDIDIKDYETNHRKYSDYISRFVKRDLGLFYMNQAARDMTGISKEDLKNIDLLDIVQERYHKLCMLATKKIIFGKQAIPSIIRISSIIKGDYVPVETRGGNRYNRGMGYDGPAGLLVCRLIDERLASEREILESKLNKLLLDSIKPTLNELLTYSNTIGLVSISKGSLDGIISLIKSGKFDKRNLLEELQKLNENLTAYDIEKRKHRFFIDNIVKNLGNQAGKIGDMLELNILLYDLVSSMDMTNPKYIYEKKLCDEPLLIEKPSMDIKALILSFIESHTYHLVGALDNKIIIETSSNKDENYIDLNFPVLIHEGIKGSKIMERFKECGARIAKHIDTYESKTNYRITFPKLN